MLRKKLSGAANRKRKASRDAENEKQKDSIKKFFKSSIPVASSSSHGEPSFENEPQQINELPHVPNIVPRSTSTDIEDDFELHQKFQDPATWPPIDDKMRILLVENGPVVKCNIQYPEDDKGRKFSDKYFYRKMANSELIHRKWLIYSESVHRVFCFCCKLFCSTLENNNLSTLITIGYSNWQNLTKTLQVHENSTVHFSNYHKWVDLEKRLKNKSTIDSQNEKMYELEKQHWRAILDRIIEVIKYLCKQMLPLRGKSDNLFVKNNGNFLQLIEVLAKFDNVTANHLQRAMKGNNQSHYLGKRIQNELISLLSKNILEKILNSVRKAKYFSIVLDCTPDISRIEQMTIIVRYVSIKNNNVTVEEHFLGFVNVTESNGAGLASCIINKLIEYNLDINNLRGQGYDNGSNMRGKHNGLQRHILNMNRRAFFIPCSSHSLNLVVNDAAKVNHKTITFFGTVQEIYNFFAASVKRWDVLKKYVTRLTLKPICNTRWESRTDALNPLRFQIGEIYDALFEIVNDDSRDKMTKYEATNLCKKIKDFQFVCSLVLWHDILTRINVISKMLQSSNINIIDALSAIKNVLEYIKNYRLNGFELLLETSEELSNILDITPNFNSSDNVRIRKRKQQFQYEHEDETPQDSKIIFKIDFFNIILDTATTSLQDRFDHLKTHDEYFQFLHNLQNLKNINKNILRKYCDDLENHLQDGEQKDINSLELFHELSIFSDLFNESEICNDPLKTLQYIYQNDLDSIYCNLCTALKILLTLPVSVASGERSFSRLKLIKSYLRSTLSQERLVDLSLIAIESDVCDQLDINKIIDEFSCIKARKVVI